MTKKCNKCSETKDYSDFYKNKSCFDGLASWCKDCSKIATSDWTKKNKVKNRDKATRWRKNNPDKEQEVKHSHYLSHREEILQKSRDYYESFSEREKAQAKKYYYENRNKVNKKNALYNKERRNKDLNFKLRGNIRVRVKLALKGKMKPSSIIKSFGCSDLASYIRSTYIEGMTDDNYGNKEGQWSIDHIIPLSKFDLADPEQFAKANHYTNLKAMWHVDNQAKSNKTTWKKEN